MTSQEKAINLRYLFLTYKPGKRKKPINAFTSFFCLYWYVSIFQKVFFTPIHVPYQRAPIMGFVDVHQVNCPIWGWNNSITIQSSTSEYFPIKGCSLYLQDRVIKRRDTRTDMSSIASMSWHSDGNIPGNVFNVHINV